MSILENSVCSFCGRRQKLLIEEEIYYNAGRNKGFVFLCTEHSYRDHENNSTTVALAAAKPSRCHLDFINNSGLALTVADYADITYNTILSIFISCPLLFLSNGKDITTVKQIVEETGEEGEGEEGLRAEVDVEGKGKGIKFKTAVKVAYNINPVLLAVLLSQHAANIPKKAK